MNGAHLHLILNHFPVMGLAIATAILAAASIRHSEELARVGVILLVVIAIVSIPVYLTGEPAEEILHDMAGVSDDLIHSHEDAGKIAFFLLEFLGVAALAGLVAFRARDSMPRWFPPIMLVMSLIAVSWVGWTSHLGGLINHPETRRDFVLPVETEESGEGEESHEH